MIVILKRYNLPERYRQLSGEELELDHFGLSAEVIKQAELIVLVEGSEVKYLKHAPEIQLTNEFDVLAQYISSVSFKDRPQWRLKREEFSNSLEKMLTLLDQLPKQR